MSGLVNGLPVASSRLTVFAPGTKMVFNQTAAPTGWTKVTGSGNDTALRVTTGTVGTGGSVAFETAFASQTPTISTPAISTPTASGGTVQSHSITEAELDQHDHKLYGYSVVAAIGGNANMCFGNATSGYSTCNTWPDTTNSTTGSSSPHTHGFTQPTISTPSSSTPTSSAIDLNVSFVDVIIATKD